MDMDFADMISSDQNLQPIMDIIEQVMSMPEEGINEQTVEVISGMMAGAFTNKIREDSINELIKNFEASNLNRLEVENNINNSKNAIQSSIEQLKPSANKKKILDNIFEIFYNIFDEALARYHTYAIELPIMLAEGAKMPTYAHDTDACADIYALEETVVPAHSLANKIHTGIYCDTPEGWQIGILPRSSTGSKTPLRLSNSRGVIDEDYRGELVILYDNISDLDYKIEAGERIAQMFVQPVYRFKGIKVDKLSNTERGEGGFGSTGK